MADTTTTPEVTTPEADDLDLIGCDHCDFTSDCEDDFASLGGDHPLYGAYPTTCNGCQEAEYKKAERLYSRLIHTHPEHLGQYR